MTGFCKQPCGGCGNESAEGREALIFAAGVAEGHEQARRTADSMSQLDDLLACLSQEDVLPGEPSAQEEEGAQQEALASRALEAVMAILHSAAEADSSEELDALVLDVAITAHSIMAGFEVESSGPTQVGGDHYEKMSMQPLEVMEAVLTREEHIGFLKGCVIKHSMREGKKPGSDDAAKARDYRWRLAQVQGKVDE